MRYIFAFIINLKLIIGEKCFTDISDIRTEIPKWMQTSMSRCKEEENCRATDFYDTQFYHFQVNQINITKENLGNGMLKINFRLEKMIHKFQSYLAGINIQLTQLAGRDSSIMNTLYSLRRRQRGPIFTQTGLHVSR